MYGIVWLYIRFHIHLFFGVHILTQMQVPVLGGHLDSVNSMFTQMVDPKLVSAYVESSVRLWVLDAGRCSATLTNHKTEVRALASNPREYLDFLFLRTYTDMNFLLKIVLDGVVTESASLAAINSAIFSSRLKIALLNKDSRADATLSGTVTLATIPMATAQILTNCRRLLVLLATDVVAAAIKS